MEFSNNNLNLLHYFVIRETLNISWCVFNNIVYIYISIHIVNIIILNN